MIFVWTMKDVIAGAFIAAGLLCFGLYYAICGVEWVQKKIKRQAKP